MIVKMKPQASLAEVASVLSEFEDLGLTPSLSREAETALITVPVPAQQERFLNLPGVAEVAEDNEPFKRASRQHHPENTMVNVAGSAIGADFTLMAGPCAVENEEQIHESARAVKRAGATILRGGAYKPRTSPYSFQGLGLDGLRLLREAANANGLGTVSEVMAPAQLEHAVEYLDIVQIGARNMQNYDLLRELGQCGRPVLLKRGPSALITELLLAAEYVMDAGNPHVILCERGIRTFETATRNTLDINAVPLLKQLSHLPVIVDPSHACGRSELVPALALASAAAGADGVIVEAHPNPSEALSDGRQSLTPSEIFDLGNKLQALVAATR